MHTRFACSCSASAHPERGLFETVVCSRAERRDPRGRGRGCKLGGRAATEKGRVPFPEGL